MPFPVSPNPGDSYTDAYGTVWIYAGSVNGWYRQTVVPNNETTYTGGGSGSATATGAAGEIQFTDGTNLAASPNLLWDDANDELEVTGDLKLLDGGSFTTTLQTITPTANRTVSIPDATGTLALVAGSSGQPVYNNAGAYAGLSTATIGTTGNISLSLNGAASTPPVSFTGTWFTGGTGTTTKPQLLIEPAGTTSTAWSTSGTGLGVNAASGFSGNLLDLQVNGTSRLSVDTTGYVKIAPTQGSVAIGYWPILYRRSDGVIDSDPNISISNNEDTLNVAGLILNSTQVRGSGTEFNFLVQSAPQHVRLNNTSLQFGAPTAGRISFGTASSQTALSSEWLRITNDGILGYNQPAPAAVDTTATLTVANLKTGIITSSTAAAVTMTLPTGTLTEGGFSGLYDNFTFEWTVINTGATNAVTVQGGTGHTLVGSGTVAAGVSGRFASRRTAANTFVTYRLS